jgi:hypothetical protein
MTNKFIGTRDFLNLCDIKVDNPRSSSNILPDLNNVYDKCSIYICNTALETFSKKIKDIKYKFILVSGDSDEEVFVDIFRSYELFKNFVENDKIIHWFCQNCSINHPKITKLPIGLAIQHVPPLNQEKDLIEIRNNSLSQDKIMKCYIDFSYPSDFYRYKNDRIEALTEIPKDICQINSCRIKRIDTWKNQSKYAFVISPHGNGLDCHRTWEALILNCIPIVKSSEIIDLYKDLPVLIVNKWSDVNANLLQTTYDKFKNQNYDYDKLLLDYWKNKINSYKILQTQPAFTRQIRKLNRLIF